MEPLVQFIGRLHPMLVHAPIGILIGLVSLEILYKFHKQTLDHSVRFILILLATASSIASIATGLIFRDDEGYSSLTADLHQWFGIGLGVVLIISCIAAGKRKLVGYAITLCLSAGLITAAGHFGASLTHGADFLTEPFASKKTTSAPTPTPTSPTTSNSPETATHASTDTNSTPPATISQFELTVAPILENHCISCHGPTKVKGNLRLDSPEAMLAGGEHGPAILTAAPLDSPILTRLLLPLDDEDHMPPDSRQQPTDAEIQAIRAWLAAGGSFTAPPPAQNPQATPAAAPTSSSATPASSTPTPTPKPAAIAPRPKRPEPASHPEASAIAALRAALIHIAPIAQNSTLYEVDVAAIAPTMDDAAIDKLLIPILTNISDLNLARTKIGQPTIALTARMPHLRKLDLSGTPIDDAAIAAIANHKSLESLTITRTSISDPAPLLTLPALTNLYCWNTKLSEDSLSTLRARPGLTLNSGSRPAPAALETEPPPVLARVGDAAAPGPSAAQSLKPINTMCPVSGKPIDASKLVVYQGRVVGLCCEHCAEAFLADPAKYADKLPKP
ncbi:MAG: hypothetical protein KGS45_11055 [Planctomycetes bacterium]|nr:hypothetical protein [Planctomycetota bacterium]